MCVCVCAGLRAFVNTDRLQRSCHPFSGAARPSSVLLAALAESVA